VSELDDPTAQEDPSGNKSNVSTVAITAIVLSICALLVSVLEVSAIRDEQRIQVWPYIDLASRYNSEGFFIEATNKGIGPARVRSLEMFLDDEPVDDLDSMIVQVLGKKNAFSYDVYKSSNPSRSVLSPGDMSTLFSVPWTPQTRQLTENMSGTFSLTLCYCSVYDDCWLARLNDGEPESVSRCR